MCNALITLFTPKLNLTEDNINSLTKHFDSNLDGTIQCVEFRSALQSKLVPTTTTVTTMDESTGEMIERIGLVNFLEGIGVDPDPNMISQPRNSSYVRVDGWDEAAEEWFEKKREEKIAV